MSTIHRLLINLFFPVALHLRFKGHAMVDSKCILSDSNLLVTVTRRNDGIPTDLQSRRT